MKHRTQKTVKVSYDELSFTGRKRYTKKCYKSGLIMSWGETVYRHSSINTYNLPCDIR